MNTHDIAREIIARANETAALPSLWGWGICNLVARHNLSPGCREFDYAAGRECCKFMPPQHGSAWLPNPGVWTEQRLNAIAFLACTTPEDFEPDAVSEVDMLVQAGMGPEQAALAVQARIESPWCYGPWDPAKEEAQRWLLYAFDWSDHPNGRTPQNEDGWNATHDDLTVVIQR